MRILKKGYVRVSHLFYIIIIAVIILAFFLVIAFGGSENASTMIGTASTVSSLILSVIAIVMTIVDVAGQRDTVSDIKETAEKLESNLNTVNEGIEEINNLKDALMESMSLIQDSNLTVLNAVVELKEKYSKTEEGTQSNLDSENVLRDLENLSEKMKTTFSFTDKFNYNNLQNGMNNKLNRIIIESVLLNNPNINKQDINEISREIFEKYGIKIHRPLIEQEIKRFNNRTSDV